MIVTTETLKCTATLDDVAMIKKTTQKKFPDRLGMSRSVFMVTYTCRGQTPSFSLKLGNTM